MYNNFSSKKTKKVISALLASALVVTSAPITADAATSKVLGVKKTFTVAGTKVTGLSKAEKKVVKVTIKNKKVTVKGLKAGKVTFKIGKKSYTVKVGATKVTATAAATTLKVNDKTTVAIKATNGAKDKLTVKSSQSAVVKVSKTSVTTDKNGKASITLKGLAAGTSTITVKSANTGKYAKVKITVKAADVATATPSSDAPATATPATDSPVGPTAVPTSGGAVTTAPTATGAATTAPTTTPVATATPATASAVTASAIAATQTGRNTITVSGTALSANVADYALKRGNSNVAIASVEVSADKTSAVLTSASAALATGDYTVTYASKSLDVKVVAETVDKVEILGTDLVVVNTYDGTTDKNATIGYRILNQFGEKMAGSITATTSLGKAVATGASRTSNGTVTVELTSAATLGVTTGSLVLVETSSGTGKVASATVTVRQKAAINKVDVLGLYDISGTTPKVAALNTGSDATKQELLFKAYDQYGNELSALKKEDVTITVSGNTGLEKAALGATFETRTVNDQTYFAIPMKGTLAKGTSVVTIVGNSVGLLSSTPIEVKAQVVVADLTITPSDTLYVGTKTEVNYVAKDTEGNEVTDYSKLNALLPASTFTNADFSWERQADGSAKLFIKPSVGEGKTLANNPSGTNSSTAVLTTQVGTNVHTITVAVFAKKVSTAIIGVKGDAAKVSIIGAQHLLFKQSDFIIQDQYGNLMTDAEVAANESGYKIVAEKEDGGKGFKDTIASNGTEISGTDNIMFDVTTKDTETGVSTYTFKLQKSEIAIPNSDCQISLTAVGIDSITDITIADLPEMYVADDDAETDTGNSAGIPLVVTGKYGALNVVINNKFYNVIGGDKPTTHLKYDAGKISARGAKVLKDGNPSSVVETIEIVVNNSAGTSVKKNVTISSVAPAVKSVKLGAGKTFALTNYDLGTAVDYGSIPEGTLDITGQYDSEIAIAAEAKTPRVTFTNLPTGATVTNNNTTTAKLNLSELTVGDYTVTMTLVYPSGVTYTNTLSINGTSNSAPAAAAANASITNAITAIKNYISTNQSSPIDLSGVELDGCTITLADAVAAPPYGGSFETVNDDTKTIAINVGTYEAGNVVNDCFTVQVSKDGGTTKTLTFTIIADSTSTYDIEFTSEA